jgi:hypothetical protein
VSVAKSIAVILIVDDDPAFLEKTPEILNRERQVFLGSTSGQAFNRPPFHFRHPASGRVNPSHLRCSQMAHSRGWSEG